MIAVLIFRNKPDRPVVEENDGVLTLWKMTMHREIANILLFESTTQFYAWMQAEWQDRYAGCDFEIHGVEDMRWNPPSFKPKCRHCRYRPDGTEYGGGGTCNHPAVFKVVSEFSVGCNYFAEG